MYLWRISNYVDLSGRGGVIAAGRWHNVGQPVVYCSDHPATALLEVLVHVDAEDLPDQYQLLKIHCPDEIFVIDAEINASDIDDISKTRAYGSRFLADDQLCILSIPSVVMPAARNYLINPASRQAGLITIETAQRYFFDKRLK